MNEDKTFCPNILILEDNEDDILVTADGYENLSIDIPKSIEEIERAMQVDLSNYLWIS